ncbi:UNVERIFIED_CONTAM: hypothetical protein Sradi_0402000 [Sesamum radiatum]|uniref:DUF674 family protein n=1 Tax=Sesamum radiatum TaxID=300843 RepID=A0AAW2W6Q1_SESRA
MKTNFNMAKSSVRLKLLVDTQTKRVLFAEVGKDCADFLFHIMSLPVATIISLLKKQGMVGSLTNLYESIENLNSSYMQPNQSKDTLLKPVVPAAGSFVSLLLLDDPPTEKKFYRCSQHSSCNFTDDVRAVCPQCRRAMTTKMTYVAPPPVQEMGDEGGFVKGVVTFIVMDNLEVYPMSTISSITLLNKFNVKDVRLLQEKVVNLGMDEAVMLLKASLQSEKVLTEVFLKSTCAGEGIVVNHEAVVTKELDLAMTAGGAISLELDTTGVLLTSNGYFLRRCLRRQSASSRIRQPEEPTQKLFEMIDDAKFPVASPSAEGLLADDGNCVSELEAQERQTSTSRPLRKAVEKVQSYKERPINAKMWRSE